MLFDLPIRWTATAGGITNNPTSQSATARLITKQFVTVRNRLVVSTDKMTSVFPITVITISMMNTVVKHSFSQPISVMGFPASFVTGSVVEKD